MMKKLYFFLLAATLCVACNNKSDRSAADGQISDFYDQRAAQSAAQQGAEATASTSSAGTGNTAIKMYEVPARLTDRPEVILHRQGFTISYNKTTKTPNWVAWHLTKSMCPAGDNKWSEQSMSQTFLLSNICPQNHGLNKNAWNDLEIQCRDWAREYNSVDIVCGPVYRTATRSDGKMRASAFQKYIGRNKVWVPDAFFKVVLCRGRQPKAIGFIYENRGGQQRMSDCMCSVDDIERITGIDFFPLLADDVENRIEARASLREW